MTAIRMKRRYLHRFYHGAFSYYCGFMIVKKPQTEIVEVNAPAFYGKPGACHTRSISDLPLTWNADDAQSFYDAKQDFAFLSMYEGKVIAGWIEQADYARPGERALDRSCIMDAQEYIRKREATE